MRAEEPDGSDGETRNAIGGSARLYGPTIQARDVSGGVHVHVPSASEHLVPRQLPPVSHHFTDRRGEVAALDRTLRGSAGTERAGAPIVVSGPAGIGKTALVSRWLRGHESDFPDGQLFAELRGHTDEGPATPEEILGQFLRALGVRAGSTSLAERAALWRSLTARRKIAVMLDNAFTAAQVRPLLPGGPNCLLVVTSRRALTGLRMDGAEFHRLEALGGEAGEELLARSVGEERVAEELSAVRQLVTLCAGLPLAVCLAAARLASRPEQSIASLVDVLAPDTGRLVQLEIDGEVTVGRALDASYEVLNAAAALLYRRLGPLPMHTYDVWTAAVVCSQSLAWAEERLYELVEANLLEDMGVEGFRFHDLVRVHARQRARDTDDDTSVRQTLRRAADWYLLSTTAAERRLTPIQLTLPRTYAHLIVLPEPFSDDEGALRWLDRQRTNLMAVVRASADQGWHPTTWQLVDAMWPLFLRLRHYELWNEAHDIGLEAARDDGNAEAERQMLNSGAIGLSAAGRTGEAADWYTASLAAARAAGDVRDEGQALLGLGGCRSEQGRPAEAVSYLNRAVRSWEACGYPRGVALAQIVLGEIALAGQDTAAAVECFTEARETLLHVDDPHDATRALAFLGRARAANGERGAGTAQMENALAVFTASGALHWQARTLEMLGDSAAEGGTAGTATELRARARVLYELTSPADARRLAQGGCLDRT